MNSRKILIMAGLIIAVVPMMLYSQEESKDDWKKVEDYVNRGLPQSALRVTDSIYLDAKDRNDAPQLLKAILYQVRLRSDYQENFMEISILALREDIEGAQPPGKQVMHSILAELYWRYYQANRNVFIDRTALAVPDPDDMQSWDLSVMMEHIISNYKASLQQEELLKKTKLDPYDPILIPAEGSKTFRPTLFDFLAHRAIDFFMSDEPGITRPAESFELKDPGYFSPARAFSEMKITTGDTTSLKYNAMVVLQELLAFHLGDKDPSAMVDGDLKRLKFVKANSILPDSDSLYLAALSSLEKEYIAHAVSTDVTYEIALEYNRLGMLYDPFEAPQYRWYFKQAMAICQDAESRFPGSYGAKNCNVLSVSMAKEILNLIVHDANIPGKPFLAHLAFKNTSKVYFRLIKMDPEKDRDMKQQNRGEGLVGQYRTMQAFREWELDLPDEGDYQRHATQIMIDPLPLGYYVIIASDNKTFETVDQSVVYTSLWITSLSYISRSSDKGTYEYFVLDRETGKPMKDVAARAFTRDYDYSTRTYQQKEKGIFITDKDGHFGIDTIPGNMRSFYIMFSKGDDRYYTDNYFYVTGAQRQEKPVVKTYFFTDRSIYRPGQTIFFKGIMIEMQGDEQKILTKQVSSVALFDVNGQKVSEQILTTGDYGSFDGTFTIPAAVLTGNMSVKNESGNVSFSVEEYKRPRFEVKIDPLQGTYKLEQEVTVNGSARTYSDAAVDDAIVNFRVVRAARFPYWRDWWSIIPSSPEREITSGQTTTDKNGAFSLTFPAIPDYQLERKFKPVFNYTVYVDVTDINGETHSVQRSVSVGYTSMVIDLQMDNELDLAGNDTFRLSCNNLNGQPVASKGKIAIYSLAGPDRVLRGRPWPRTDVFLISRDEFTRNFPQEIYDNEDNYSTREDKSKVLEITFDTPGDSIISIPGLSGWEPGIYRFEITAEGTDGNILESKEYFTAYNPMSKTVPAMKADWFKVMKKEAEPGETVSLLAGTAEKDTRLLYELVNKGRIIQRTWIDLDREQVKIDIPVTEEYRGNFSVNMTFVKGNRIYSHNELIKVPYTDRMLDLQFETFRDKLTPGQEEEWRIRITGKEGNKVIAEMLASMYDASLDAFVAHDWSFNILKYYQGRPGWQGSTAFSTNNSFFVTRPSEKAVATVTRGYDQLNWFGFNYYGSRFMRGGRFDIMPMQGVVAGTPDEKMENAGMDLKESELAKGGESPRPVQGEIQEESVPVRRNFEETAFFYPSLMTDENGEAIVQFRVPESLTRWNFMGMAYTKDLKYGFVDKEIITSKELMVVPNPPRFLRVGDKLGFSVKVVSLADRELSGKVTLEFFNAYTMEPVNDLLGLKGKEQSFSVAKGSSGVYSWDITVPDGLEAIVYRVTAAAEDYSDGEEMAIPVLPNRMLVTESMPMPVRGKGTKEFHFSKLAESADSKSIRSYRLTLEFTSNPAWYAIQALPYLAEEPHENADALFNRFYANSIAGYIANSSPKIKQVFDAWKNITPDALLSNLEKNQQVKDVFLQETPWVLQARNETERKKRVALLFDLNRMGAEKRAALLKLQKMQTPNGGWPWFEGMRDNRYITQLIITGLGRMQHQGIIDITKDADLMIMVRKGLYYMDDRIREDYEDLQKKLDEKQLAESHLGSSQVQYLYARSFFEGLIRLDESGQQAFNYFKDQASKFWTDQNQYLQGMIALALNRLDDSGTANSVIRSLKEHALYSDEMGMYWREPAGYYWYQAPVERQAMMLEAFSEVAGDDASVELIKIWLLKQKQTQDWKTSRATADAVYALLLKGTDLLDSNRPVEVVIGGEKIDQSSLEGTKAEAGTGYFQVSWSGSDIKPGMADVNVTKDDEGIAWGAVYWQYFEDLDKITPAQTPLSLEKELYLEKNTPSGPVLEKIDDSNSVTVGSKIMVRIILRADRDMDYVHMKDMRAASFEPVNVLSGNQYQGGLGYYEAPKDASTNFYFDHLRKGTYVFEYLLVVNQKGDFSNGITTIQCLYAPEFSAHSKGIRMTSF